MCVFTPPRKQLLPWKPDVLVDGRSRADGGEDAGGATRVYLQQRRFQVDGRALSLIDRQRELLGLRVCV